CACARRGVAGARRRQDTERRDPGRAAPGAHRAPCAEIAERAGLLEPQGARQRHTHRTGPRALFERVRIVFDTSILLSTLTFPGGRGEAALLRIVEERDQLFLSKPILDELLGILARKFARDAEELARTAIFISALGTTVRPRRKLRVVKDEPDNRLLECAVAG